MRKMIHTQKRNKDGLPSEKIKTLIQKYESILEIATDEYLQHPPSKEYLDGYNLQKWLRDYQTDHLYFLSHLDVVYANSNENKNRQLCFGATREDSIFAMPLLS